MQHADPEDLALVALGETPETELAAHLADCEPCLAELEQLRAAVRVGRDTATDDRLLQPPPAVWSAIHEELGLRTVPAVLAAPAAPPSGSPSPSGDHAAPRRRRRTRLVVTLLAAAAIVAVAAGLVLPRVLAPAAPQVIARARLAALPGWSGASGTATLERLPDGHRALQLRLVTPTVGGDYRELWLIDPKTNALVSLGIVDRGSATFAVPNDLDLKAYDLVDVSRERPDGNPAHSGDSIVRGTLSS